MATVLIRSNDGSSARASSQRSARAWPQTRSAPRASRYAVTAFSADWWLRKQASAYRPEPLTSRASFRSCSDWRSHAATTRLLVDASANERLAGGHRFLEQRVSLRIL